MFVNVCDLLCRRWGESPDPCSHGYLGHVAEIWTSNQFETNPLFARRQQVRLTLRVHPLTAGGRGILLVIFERELVVFLKLVQKYQQVDRGS